MTLVDSKGRYKFVDLQRGKYTLSLSCPDYQPVEETFELTGDKRLTYVIYPMKHIELEEVSVVADKSQLITHTANSDVFYLSAEAKKKQNPYEALREIPKLVVNESDRSIKIVEETNRQARKLVGEIEALLITARRNRQKILLQKEETNLILLATAAAQEVSMLHTQKPHQIKIETEFKELKLMLDPYM